VQGSGLGAAGVAMQAEALRAKVAARTLAAPPSAALGTLRRLRPLTLHALPGLGAGATQVGTPPPRCRRRCCQQLCWLCAAGRPCPWPRRPPPPAPAPPSAGVARPRPWPRRPLPLRSNAGIRWGGSGLLAATPPAARLLRLGHRLGWHARARGRAARRPPACLQAHPIPTTGDMPPISGGRLGRLQRRFPWRAAAQSRPPGRLARRASRRRRAAVPQAPCGPPRSLGEPRGQCLVPPGHRCNVTSHPRRDAVSGCWTKRTWMRGPQRRRRRPSREARRRLRPRLAAAAACDDLRLLCVFLLSHALACACARPPFFWNETIPYHTIPYHNYKSSGTTAFGARSRLIGHSCSL
jgi:hypothetical protein